MLFKTDNFFAADKVFPISDINAFNAGKKKDKALELLSAWLPDVEKFSKEIGKHTLFVLRAVSCS